MAKILIRLGPTHSIEIVNLKKVWIEGSHLSFFSLMYSDDNYESNTIYNGEDKIVMLSHKEILEYAAKNGITEIRM
jgi:hypothetical protein